MILTVATAAPRTAPLALVSVTVKVCLPSIALVSISGMLIVSDRSLATNVTVPLEVV